MPTKTRLAEVPDIGDSVHYQGAPHTVTWVGTTKTRLGVRVTLRDPQHSGPEFTVDLHELDPER